MIIYKVINKIKDNNGKIIKYKLVNDKKKEIITDSEELLSKIKNNEIDVLNLKVTENNRLIDTDKKILLYHGNKDINMVPSFGKGKDNNDYGQGFYTTLDMELAKEWAYVSYNMSEGKGHVHTYIMDTSELKILNFDESKTLNWIAELMANREVNVKNKPALLDRLNKFISKYKIDTSSYDVIIGYRADDSYFNYIRSFLEESIYLEHVEKAVYLDDLGKQFFIKSKKAFSKLKLVCVKEVSNDYKKRADNRREKTNNEYQKVIETKLKNGITISDVINKKK